MGNSKNGAKAPKAVKPVVAVEQSTEEVAVVAEATEPIETVETDVTGWLRMPKREPLFDSGFTLPTITEPSKLSIDLAPGVPYPKNGQDREFAPVKMGNHRFVQWIETLQGYFHREQERVDKLGLGITVFVEKGDDFFLDPSLEWTCSRAGLKVAV